MLITNIISIFFNNNTDNNIVNNNIDKNAKNNNIANKKFFEQ